MLFITNMLSNLTLPKDLPKVLRGDKSGSQTKDPPPVERYRLNQSPPRLTYYLIK